MTDEEELGEGTPAHGTYARYQQHIRYGDEPCQPCRAATADYNREYRKRKPETLTKQKLQAKRRSLALQELAKRHHREYLEILTEIKRVEVKVRRAA